MMPLISSSATQDDILVATAKGNSIQAANSIPNAKQSKPSRKKAFSPSSYMVVYEELMACEDAKKEFASYLKTARNTEPLEFLEELHDYKHNYTEVVDAMKSQSPSDETVGKLLGQLLDLVEIFIVHRGRKQINLPTNLVESCSRMIRNLLSMFMDLSIVKEVVGKRTLSCTLTPCTMLESAERDPSSSKLLVDMDPDRIFTQISFLTNLDLKMDQFPRFARSNQLSHFLQLKGEEFTRTVAINTCGFSIDIRCKPNDFRSKVVTDRDIYFSIMLSEDTPDWQLINTGDSSQDYFNIYISKTTYVIGTEKMEGMKLLKCEFQLNYCLDDVWAVFVDVESRYDWDRNLVKDGHYVQYYEPSSESIEKQKAQFVNVLKGVTGDRHEFDFKNPPLALQHMAIGIGTGVPFMKVRDFPHCMTTVYDPGANAYICTGHTTVLDGREKVNGRIDTDILFNFIFFRTGESCTRVVHSIYCDFELVLNADVFAKIIWKMRAKMLKDGFESVLKERTRNNTQHLSIEQDSLNYNRAVFDNAKAYPNRSWFLEYQNQKSKTLKQ